MNFPNKEQLDQKRSQLRESDNGWYLCEGCEGEFDIDDLDNDGHCEECSIS